MYFIRQSHLADDSDTTNALSKILLDRTAKWIIASFLKLGLKLDDAIKAYRDLVADVVDAITDPTSDLGDFFQAKFWKALKGDLSNMHDRQVRADYQDQLHVSLTDPVQDSDAGEGGESGGEQVQFGERVDSGQDIELDTLYRLEVQQGLHSVRNPLHRKAFVLHYFEHWPIETKDHRKPSLTRYFKVTERTIRNWLEAAKLDLRAWREARGAL